MPWYRYTSLDSYYLKPSSAGSCAGLYRSQCCGSGSGRIQTISVGSGSCPNKWPCFGVCKSQNNLRNLCCITLWFMNTGILFRAYFHHKIFQKKLGRNLSRSGSAKLTGTTCCLILCSLFFSSGFICTRYYLFITYLSWILCQYAMYELGLYQLLADTLHSLHHLLQLQVGPDYCLISQVQVHAPENIVHSL
jgi:hypothetical protein